MTFFFQTKTIGVIFKNILALPSFIMGVNGILEAQQEEKYQYS